jgi:hypothetical protein
MEEVAMEPDRKKGHFTFRTTAVLLIASAVFELLSITDEVPLFSEIRGGITAGIYHIAYVVLFLALGIGLWGAKKWGYTIVFVLAALYTLDALQLLLGQQVMETYLATQISGYESVFQSLGLNAALLTQLFVFTRVLVVLCWWGFALYTYWRRDYFKNTGA